MNLKIQEVDIEGIDKNMANDLMNELNAAIQTDMVFTDKYPALYEFYKLLNGAFRSSHNGIHFISRRE